MADMAKPDDIEVEKVERPSGNLFGKTLSKLKSARWIGVQDAKQKMFDRHKISFADRNRYRIVEDCTIGSNGDEVIELRLYKLIDGAVVTIKSEVNSELAGGINNLREFNRDGSKQN